jgi:hypothetical protein
VGIHQNLIPLLEDVARHFGFSGEVCTLGVQDLPPGENTVGLFAKLGFTNVKALDVSGYEGADYIFDLNSDQLPAELRGRFDVVFNGGTIEHVFHVPNALASTTNMIKVGGAVVHIVPCNGWVDHGFYQISPTLLFDYYSASGFVDFYSALCSFAPERPRETVVRPIFPGGLGAGTSGAITSGVHLCVFAARKTASTVTHAVPTQSFYSTRPVRAPVHWFEPYHMKDGAVTARVGPRELDSSAFTHLGEHMYGTRVADLVTAADTNSRPARSPLVLLEDGLPIAPAHALHAVVREKGAGSYSHWEDWLLFSSSENSDPRVNGRRYSIVIAPRLYDE